MIKNKKEHYKPIVRFFSAFAVWGAMLLLWNYIWSGFYIQSTFYSDRVFLPFFSKGNWLILLIYGVLLFVFTNLYGGYRVGYYRRGNVMFSAVMAMLLTNIFTYFQVCLVGYALMPVWPVIWMSAADFIIIWFWVNIATGIYLALYPPHRILVIYGGSHLTDSLIKKMTLRSEKYEICETVNISAGLEEIYDRISDYEAVMLCDIPSVERNKILKYCFNHSVRAYITPKISDVLIRGSSNISLFDTPLLLSKNQGLTFEQRLIKRVLDIILSLAAIMISSPLMLLSVLLILIFDGGPVIFRQKRLTIGGREFYIFKFRSMVRNAESECGARLCSINDMRVTKIGRVLRVLRFDELPQLFNILRGDMSLVGPRPERPEIAAEYKKYIPEFDFRLKVKAGLTGYAQVFGKYNTTPYDKLKLDLMYISAYSLVEDFKLMMMTAKIIFIRESTEGVDGDLLPGDTPLPGPEAEIGIIDPPETSKTGDGR